MAELIQPQMGLNFEQVWAALMEDRQQMKETDRQMKETDRQMKETDRQMKETDRQMKALQKSMGNLGNRFGELIEHLVSPNLLEKFKVLGYAFNRTNTRVEYKDSHTGKTLAEVDVLLENGDCVLVVEIKADPTSEDVHDHIKRMETLRVYADACNDTRGYLGAIAGRIVGGEVRKYALKQGFYVLEQAGDTVNITATPEWWKPRRW